MTNQLEEELKAIQNTITKTQQKKAEPHISTEYHKYLSKKLEQLRYEEKTILQKLGIQGDIL